MQTLKKDQKGLSILCVVVLFCALTVIHTELHLSRTVVRGLELRGRMEQQHVILRRGEWSQISSTHEKIKTNVGTRGKRNDPIFTKKNIPRNVISWNGKEDLKTYMSTYFKEKNLICDLAQQQASGPSSSAEEQHYLLNITFGCNDLFYNSGLGSGNYIAGFYAIRLAAQVLGNVDVSIHCPDATQEQTNLILPWLTGYFPSGRRVSNQMRAHMQSRANEICENIDRCPIGYMFPQVQNELRRMAVSLVGIPAKNHSTYPLVSEWVSEHIGKATTMQLDIQQPPLYPGTDLDETVLHFRCGDLMMSDHPRFGFLKFDSFAKHISAESRSIGIVTQPFDSNAQTRAWDSGEVKRKRCRTVVLDFVAYLQERFPNSRVRVHNSPDETIALTYARMVMANQTIAGISTFGVFPAIASFGTGYIRLPDEKSATNGWLVNPRLDSLMPSKMVLMDEPNILMVRQVKKLWEEHDGQSKILAWFRDSSLAF